MIMTGPEIDHQRAGLQCMIEMVLKQYRQLWPISRGPSLLDQVLQNDACVIGITEESPVDPPTHTLVDPGSRPQQDCAEGCSQCDATGHGCRRKRLQVAGEDQSKSPCHTDAQQGEQNYKATLHQQIAHTPSEQDWDFEYTMLDHGIGERQGEKPQQDGQGYTQPKTDVESEKVVGS